MFVFHGFLRAENRHNGIVVLHRLCAAIVKKLKEEVERNKGTTTHSIKSTTHHTNNQKETNKNPLSTQ